MTCASLQHYATSADLKPHAGNLPAQQNPSKFKLNNLARRKNTSGFKPEVQIRQSIVLVL